MLSAFASKRFGWWRRHGGLGSLDWFTDIRTLTCDGGGSCLKWRHQPTRRTSPSRPSDGRKGGLTVSSPLVVVAPKCSRHRGLPVPRGSGCWHVPVYRSLASFKPDVCLTVQAVVRRKLRGEVRFSIVWDW